MFSSRSIFIRLWLAAVLALLCGAISASAQTTLSGTVVDQQGQPWQNATWTLTFYPTAACTGVQNGSSGQFTGHLSSAGAYSLTVPKLCGTAPSFTMTVTPFTTIATVGGLAPTGGNYVSPVFTVSGSTQTLNFTPPAPMFPYQLNTFGYSVAELTANPTLPGSVYYIPFPSPGSRLTWTGSEWANLPSQGGCTPSGAGTLYLFDNGSGGCAEGYIGYFVGEGDLNILDFGANPSGSGIPPDMQLSVGGAGGTGQLTMNFTDGSFDPGFVTMNLGQGGLIVNGDNGVEITSNPYFSGVFLKAPNDMENIYSILLPPLPPTSGNTFLSCTPASTAICSWAAGGAGGTTAFPLTLNNSGGAAPGTTFNGAAPVTADYHTFGAGGLAAANNWSAFNIFGAGIDVNGTAELDGFVVYPCAGSVGNPALDGPSINLLLYSGFLHVKATGNCYLGSAAFTLTAVSNASGGTTTYTGTITGGASNAFANQYATISGFTNVANSGTWVVTASTATTITVNNTYGVAETHAGTANVNGAIIVPSLSHLDLKTATVTVGTSNATPPYSAGAITDVDATNPTTVSFSCTATASSNLLTGCSPATLAASDFEQSMECVAGLGAATNLKTVISNVVSSSSVYLNDAFGSTFSTGTVACTETIRTHDFKIELGDVEHATHSNWGTMLVNHCNRAYVIGGYENDQSGDWVNVSLDCDDSRFDTMYINGAKDGLHFIGPQQNPRATGTFYTADDAVAFDTGENCCSVSLTLTAAANASGGSTVYTGTITGGASNALANQYATISGFTNGANNGTWRITASTATTITVSNPSGVAETHAGTAFIPLLIYNASGSINNLYAEVSGGGGSRGVAVETIAINPSGTQCIIPSITNGVVIVHGDGLYTGSTSGQAGYGGYVVPVDIGTGSLNSCTTAPSKVLADNLTVMADGSAPYGYYTLLYSGLIGTQFGKITVFNPPNLNAQPVATLPYAAGAVSTYSDTNKSMTIANLQIVGAQAYSGSMKLFNSANSTGGTTTISLFNSDGPNPADYNTSGVTITTNNSAYTAAPASGGPNCMQISTTGQITNTGSACGSGSAGVSSFTGDGALLNNSASTGVVTATLASTGVGYGVWGNTGSSSAAPGYHALSSYPAVAFPTLNQSTTGSAATATQSTNATNVNGGTVSATTGTFSGTVAAGTTTPTTIGSNGVLLNGVPALQSQTSLYNCYSGGSGNLTGTGSNNTANGYQALAANTTGVSNTANGYMALNSNTTGSYNAANGMYALYANTTGTTNVANGVFALQANTSGNDNVANGYQALASNTFGSNNTVSGYQAGQYIADGVTANQTSSNSVYEGFRAYPLASGDTNENVIGNTAIGHGSNTTTLGNTSTTGVYLNGALYLPAARKGTFVCTASGTITISNTNELATSDVIISLNTAGGTISTSPAMKTVTAGSGFTVLCGAGDTSTYNYDILN